MRTHSRTLALAALPVLGILTSAQVSAGDVTHPPVLLAQEDTQQYGSETQPPADVPETPPDSNDQPSGGVQDVPGGEQAESIPSHLEGQYARETFPDILRRDN
jgi:hypothetical protein